MPYAGIVYGTLSSVRVVLRVVASKGRLHVKCFSATVEDIGDPIGYASLCIVYVKKIVYGIVLYWEGYIEIA